MTPFINEQLDKAGFKWYDRFKNKTFIYFCEDKIVVLHSHWVKRRSSFAFDVQQVASIDAQQVDFFIMELTFRSEGKFLGSVHENMLGWESFFSEILKYFPEFDMDVFEKLKRTSYSVMRCWQRVPPQTCTT